MVPFNEIPPAELPPPPDPTVHQSRVVEAVARARLSERTSSRRLATTPLIKIDFLGIWPS
jgi:hypothetical protein